MSQPRRLAGPCVLILLLTAALVSLGAGASGAAAPPGCATALLARSAPAYDVAAHAPRAFAAAAARQGRSSSALAHLATDHTLWLDRCGREFFTEKPAAGATTSGSTASGPATATVPLADTFTLQSRPGANRTIYLDFLGGTVTGTAWNASYGSSITVDPYSSSTPTDTNFSDAELTEIQRTWQVVAEDYAPFDVNVTTQDPGAAALDRSSSTDQVYGTTVMITAGGPIYDSCGCGGMAYVNVFNDAGSNHAYYQPAFVFTNGTGTNGKYIGEAASHEAGHTFGLHHDGTSTVSYYAGASPWAPIMGSSYSQPVSQWSRGEYAGANNTEDDLAIIATGAPLRADDHGDTASTATALANGGTLNGVIGTRGDVDAFGFSAAGTTTLSVTPAAGLPDLDARLVVADASGATVATVDPTAARSTYQTATGLGATWSVTLPSTTASYTAYVDGTGTGDPTTAGLYSDYDSLGNYQISLTTQGSQTTPLTATGSDPPPATAGTAYSATPVTASGGSGGYRFAANGLPSGLSMSASTGAVSGTPTAPGSSSVAVTVTDSSGSTASTAVTVTVQPGSTPVSTTNQTLPAATAGTAYAAQLSASGGDGSYAWTATSALPAGLSLSSSGAVSGTPTTAGSYSFTATVSSAGSTAAATVSLTVSTASAPLAFTTSANLPSGRTGQAYAATIGISGGSPGYTWTRSGNLPAGLTLTVAADGRSATLSGTPTARGKSSFSLTVTDATGASTTRKFTVNINR